MFTRYLTTLRRNPRFARVWMAQVVSQMGDWFSLIALSALVSRYSNGSGMAVSTLFLAMLLPSVIVGPFAGVLVDRFDRKRLMVISDLVRFVITLAFLLVRSPDQLWLVYALTAAQFTLSTLFEPARSAIVPSLVQPDDLLAANVLGSVTWSAMLALGSLLGGSVTALLGTQTALLLNSFSFLLSALLLFSIAGAFRAAPGDHERQASETGGVGDALAYLAARPPLIPNLLAKAGGSIAAIDTLLIIFATRIFPIGTDGALSLGVLWACFGVGAILGPLLLGRFGDGSTRALQRLILVALVCCTVGMLALSVAPVFALVALAIVVRAVGGATAWTFSSVIIQKSFPDRYLGRMFALDLVAYQVVAFAATLAQGLLLERAGDLGVRQVVLSFAAISLLPLVLWAVFLARRPAAAPRPATP